MSRRKIDLMKLITKKLLIKYHESQLQNNLFIIIVIFELSIISNHVIVIMNILNIHETYYIFLSKVSSYFKTDFMHFCFNYKITFFNEIKK